jgi:acyl-coenzyme A thioesterase PaaI-like protein
MPESAAVLSVEFKINLMKPAAGSLFRATGKVVRSGRTLTVCSGVVEANFENRWTDIAVMQATMMAVLDNKTLKG